MIDPNEKHWQDDKPAAVTFNKYFICALEFLLESDREIKINKIFMMYTTLLYRRHVLSFNNKNNNILRNPFINF